MESYRGAWFNADSIKWRTQIIQIMSLMDTTVCTWFPCVRAFKQWNYDWKKLWLSLSIQRDFDWQNIAKKWICCCLQPETKELIWLSLPQCAQTGWLNLLLFFGQQCSPPTNRLLPVIGPMCMKAPGCRLCVFSFLLHSSSITLCSYLGLRNMKVVCALSVTDTLLQLAWKPLKDLFSVPCSTEVWEPAKFALYWQS